MTVHNILDKNCKIQSRSMLIDTNVLLYYFYDKVGYLGEDADSARIREYSSFFEKVLEEKVSIYTHKISISEFVNEIYSTELKLLYTSTYGPLNGKKIPNRKKFVRDHIDKDKLIRKDLLTYVNKIRQYFILIKGVDDVNTLLCDATRDWLSSHAEMADAIMITEAKSYKVDSILSDDSDMVSFNDFNLYTANPRALHC